jgi:transposase
MDTPNELRALIIKKYLDNESQKVISNQLKVSRSTVCDIIKKFRHTGEMKPNRQGKCGRHRILTIRDDRLLARASSEHPQATPRQLQQQVGGSIARVCSRTVRRSLHLSGISAYRPMKAPFLSKEQMKTRLLWAEAHVHWSAEKWKQVRDLNWCK